LHNYDIVFQEIPDEITLALNISNCPNRCAGCHSPHLREDAGAALDESALSQLLEKYGSTVTCICFMGGDGSPGDLLRLAKHAKRFDKKLAWYSGNATLHEHATAVFDYVKLGGYVEELGGLDAPDTNQRFYRIEKGKMIDETGRFRRKRERYEME